MNFSVVGSCGCAVTLVIFDMFKLRFESRGVLSICFQKSKSSPAFQQQKLKHVNPNGSRVSAKKEYFKIIVRAFKKYSVRLFVLWFYLVVTPSGS